MALSVREASFDTEREFTIKAGLEGFPDRHFVMTWKADGIEVREKGESKYRKMRYEVYARWLFMHCPLIERR